MKESFKFLGILFFLLICKPSYATDLINIYEQAVDYDYTLKRADSIRQTALEVSPQSLSQFYPVLHLSANVSKTDQKVDYKDPTFPSFTDSPQTHTYNLSLQQKILDLSAMTRIKQADVQVAAAEIQYVTTYQILLYRICGAYFEILASQDALSLYTAEKDLINYHLKKVKQRHEQGKVADVDLHDIQAGYDISLTNINNAQIRIAIAKETLRELTGKYYPDLSPIKNDANFLYPEPNDVSWWAEAALNQNYDVIAAKLAYEISRHQIKIQNQQYFPTLDLIGNYNFLNNEDADPQTFPSKNTTTSISLQLNWNLYRGGLDKSFNKQTRFKHQQAKMNLTLQQRYSEREIRGVYYTILTELARMNTLYQSILSHQKALKANEVAYELEIRSVIELISSINKLYNNQRTYAQSRYNYILQYVRLNQLAGILDQSLMSKVNKLLSSNK